TEVLLPLVSDDGKILTEKQAIAQYEKTGKSLGKFDSKQAANSYAKTLHEDYENGKIPGYEAAGGDQTKWYDKPLFNRTGKYAEDLMSEAAKNEAAPAKKYAFGKTETEEHKHLRTFEEGFGAGVADSMGGLTTPKNLALLLPGMLSSKVKSGD